MITFKRDTYKVPVKAWLPESEIEASAMEQIDNCASLPFVFDHVAIMPDVHCGYGVTIGSVLATEGVIIPNAVGVDIGCGMCSVKTPWTTNDIPVDKIKKIMGRIRELVPVGFNHQKEFQLGMPNYSFDSNVIKKEYDSATKQLGTLGGGNHFIEIQKDKDGCIWIMIHSGSRNLGKQVADYYTDFARDLNKQWHSGIPTKWDLAFLPIDTEYGKQYLQEMQYCVDFAFANRKLMMQNIAHAFEAEMNWKSIDLSSMINIAHNYATMENHFGKNVMVHRKGATSARQGELGLIPGSQGTKSYIVKGKGNPESFNSCSHGAGRKLGRKAASKTLNLEEEIKKMNDQGIVHGLRTEKDLDEAAGAYKDINQVMKNQEDLVEIVTELSPLAVIKA